MKAQLKRLGYALDWTRERTLHFGDVDPERYPALNVVLATARSGDAGAMVGLSAADELAVARFLAGETTFSEIPSLLRRGAELGAGPAATLADIERIDARVRAELASLVASA